MFKKKQCRNGDLMRYYPAIFAVGKNYSIFVLVKSECFMWVEVGGKRYCDHVNGVMRSGTMVHHVEIPCEELEREKKYTVVTKKIIKRLPYRTLSEAPVSSSYSFKPISNESDINVIHIADTHGKTAAAIDAAKKSGKLDLLVLNGDIVSSCRKAKDFDVMFELASAITEGEIPTVFSRGNHDLRGACAENLSDYSPTLNGKTYFTFRLGSAWGIVLDCGEDKPDSHEEYSGAVCCHDFRQDETAFIEAVIKHAKEEYEAPGIKHRLVIVHNPFTHVCESPFDIEQDIYGKWCKLLKDEIKPSLMLCGHMHENCVSPVGGDFDDLGQPCTVVVGSQPENGGKAFTAAYVKLAENGESSIDFVTGCSH